MPVGRACLRKPTVAPSSFKRPPPINISNRTLGADRVLQIGDASGIQSPLSFGGFGALMRHARRLVGALEDALACDALSK